MGGRRSASGKLPSIDASTGPLSPSASPDPMKVPLTVKVPSSSGASGVPFAIPAKLSVASTEPPAEPRVSDPLPWPAQLQVPATDESLATIRSGPTPWDSASKLDAPPKPVDQDTSPAYVPTGIRTFAGADAGLAPETGRTAPTTRTAHTTASTRARPKSATFAITT